MSGVAIVTGGATGIGRGIVETLTAKGYRVAIVQPERAQAAEAAAAIAGAGGFGADVRDAAQVAAMVEAVEREMGPVAVLVNNAALTGLPAVGSFVATPPAQVEAILDVNLKGAIWCSQAVARAMIAGGRPGSIVNIASVGAFAAQELASIYCASKAGLVALTQAMGLELAPHGIRVNAVAPGDILTPASRDITEELRALGATGRYGRTTPLGRRGSPEDIGEAVAFLVSEAAGFITGTTLTVDGGFLSY